MTAPGDRAGYQVEQEIAIGQSTGRRAGARLSPVLNEPTRELQTWQTQWRHDQERLALLQDHADDPLSVSATGEVLVFAGDPDREWVPLAALVARAARANSARPVLIVNLAGGTTPARLQATLRGYSPVTCAVTSAGAGSNVPVLFGPAFGIVSTILGLVTATADETISSRLRVAASAIREELEISARPVAVLSAVLDDAAGVHRSIATSADAAGVPDGTVRAAAGEVMAEFGRDLEISDLRTLADMVRPLRRFEGRAPLARVQAGLRILNLDEESAPPGERELGRAILAGFLKRHLASPQAGVVIVIDAGKLDAELWRATSGLDPATLLVTMYQEFSGRGQEAASGRVPSMLFFRLAGQDAIEAGRQFGSDEVMRESSRSTQESSSINASKNKSGTISTRRSSVAITDIQGRTEGVTHTRTEQLTEKARIRPNEFTDLRDREFVCYKRHEDGHRFETGRLPADGAV
jgi:hypothetical protein